MGSSRTLWAVRAPASARCSMLHLFHHREHQEVPDAPLPPDRWSPSSAQPPSRPAEADRYSCSTSKANDGSQASNSFGLDYVASRGSPAPALGLPNDPHILHSVELRKAPVINNEQLHGTEKAILYRHALSHRLICLLVYVVCFTYITFLLIICS